MPERTAVLPETISLGLMASEISPNSNLLPLRRDISVAPAVHFFSLSMWPNGIMFVCLLAHWTAL